MHLKRKDSIKLKNIRKWMDLTKLLHPFRFIAISDGL